MMIARKNFESEPSWLFVSTIALASLLGSYAELVSPFLGSMQRLLALWETDQNQFQNPLEN